MVIVGFDADGAEGTYQVEKSQGYLYPKPRTGCDESQGFYDEPSYPGYCLKYEYYYEDVFFDEGAFWKIQNSWGENWGDKGFAYFEANTHEYGVCNMNKQGGVWVKTNQEESVPSYKK